MVWCGVVGCGEVWCSVVLLCIDMCHSNVDGMPARPFTIHCVHLAAHLLPRKLQFLAQHPCLGRMELVEAIGVG